MRGVKDEVPDERAGAQINLAFPPPWSGKQGTRIKATFPVLKQFLTNMTSSIKFTQSEGLWEITESVPKHLIHEGHLEL